jgi:hypothetical protein
MPMTLGCTTPSKSGFKGLEPLPKTMTVYIIFTHILERFL